MRKTMKQILITFLLLMCAKPHTIAQITPYAANGKFGIITDYFCIFAQIIGYFK